MLIVAYSKLVEILCFICHGKCCREGMEFVVEGRKVELTKKSGIPCNGWNRLTGRCRIYNKKRLWLCEQYKCIMLNLLSRLFGQPEWKGRYE